MMTRTKRLGGIAAVGSALAAAVLIVTPITPVAASAATSDGVLESDCRFGRHLGAVWGRLPADLRSDVRGLDDLSAEERADRVREIRADALAGEYGDRVQNRAERRAMRWSAMPDDLKAELIEVAAAEPSERADLLRGIGDDALAGEYGEPAQKIIERMRASQWWQTCVAP